MTTLFREELLYTAAHQLTQQLAAALPTEETPPSAALTQRLNALPSRVERRERIRSAWQRTAAAIRALVLALGAVVAVSPTAQATAERWILKVTNIVTRYWFAPTAASETPWDGLPTWTPEGSQLLCDLQGHNDKRILRYTTPHGDILLERLTMGGEEYEVEIRSHETDGLSNTLTGQRPMGVSGAPDGYERTALSIGGHEAYRYDFYSSEGVVGGSGDYGLRCYRNREWVHYVAIPAGAAVLIWQDEAAQELFVLVGTEPQTLEKMALSIYE